VEWSSDLLTPFQKTNCSANWASNRRNAEVDRRGCSIKANYRKDTAGPQQASKSHKGRPKGQMVKSCYRDHEIKIAHQQGFGQDITLQKADFIRDRGGGLCSTKAFMIHVDGDDLITVLSQFLGKRSLPAPYIERASAICWDRAQCKAMVVSVVIPTHCRNPFLHHPSGA
jgi:hypothetical protein